MYMNVLYVCVCICTYLYVLSVFVCITYMDTNNLQFIETAQPPLAQWEILTHVTVVTSVRVPEQSLWFCCWLFAFLQPFAGHEVLAWESFSLLRHVQNKK